MDTIDIEFQIAIACENLAGAVYHEFAKKFAHVPEVEEFWNSMVKDEEIHAKNLKEIYAALTDEQRNSKADPYLMHELKGFLELQLEEVTGPVETLDDAFKVVNELEDSEINAVFRALTKEFIPKKERRRALINTVEVHLVRLTNFSENYGDAAFRKSIKAQ